MAGDVVNGSPGEEQKRLRLRLAEGNKESRSRRIGTNYSGARCGAFIQSAEVTWRSWRDMTNGLCHDSTCCTEGSLSPSLAASS